MVPVASMPHFSLLPLPPKISLAVVAFLTLSHGCQSDSSDQSTAPGRPTTGVGVYTSDTTVLAQAVGDLLDDVTSTLAENGAGGSLIYTASLQKARLPLAENNAFARTCTVDDEYDPVNVTIDVDAQRVFSGQLKGGQGKGAFSWVTKFEGTGRTKRVWTRPEPGLIGCNEEGTRLSLDWNLAENVEGLRLAVEDDRTSSRQATSTQGTPVYARKSTIKGKRTAVWRASGDAEEGAELSRFKTMTVDVLRTLTLTTAPAAGGERVTLKTKITTQDANPLEASVTRVFKVQNDELVGSLKKITLTKGSLKARNEEAKTTLETSFENVVFDPASNTPCVPKSGKITGRVLGDGDPSGSVSFELNFADKNPANETFVSLKVGNDEKKTCEACLLDACDMAL